MFITNIIFILSILLIQADPNVYFYCAFNGNAEKSMHIMTKKFNNESKDAQLNFTDWNIFNTTTSNMSNWENYKNGYNDTEKYVEPNLKNLDDYVKSFFKNNNNNLHFNMLYLLITFSIVLI